MEQENLEEGRGKKGQARQAGRTQEDEWGAKERLKKSFRNYADKRKNKTSHLDEKNLDKDNNQAKVKANESFVDALTEEGLQAIEIGINEYFLTLGEEVDQETFDAMVEEVATNLVADLTEAEEAGSILEFNNKETKKTKSDIIESVVDKYATEVEYEEISEEDHIIDVLSKHIHEKQIAKVLDLYDSLDEENREELLDLIETKEGINEVINFIIEDSKTSEEE